MRLINAIILSVLLLASYAFANPQVDYNELSAYYGFDEIEIIKLDWKINSLRIADFNGDKRNDIALVNNVKAKIELLIQKEDVGVGEKEVFVDAKDIDINAINPPSRFDRQSLAISQKVTSFVCGDLNSDGLTDIAFYGVPEGLYVILQKTPDQKADRIKTLSWRTRKKIKIDDGLLTPNVLQCADLNNDGTDDLVLAGRDSVYLVSQKEDGSLAEPLKYPTDATTLGIEVGDLNGDNINDLVLITNDIEKPIHVRFGLNTGQLGPQVHFFIEKPWAFMLGNSDGIVGDEILTIDARSGRLACYKFTAEKEEDRDWPILFYPLVGGENSENRDLVTGDFDGDGLMDIIVSDPDAAELIFYRQVAGIGLAEAVKFPAFSDISNLSVTDVDGDGISELGVLSIKEKIVGLSRFENGRICFPQPIKLEGEPVGMELADIDGNGSVDCVYLAKDADDVRYMRVLYDFYSESKNADIEETLEQDKISSDEIDLFSQNNADQSGLKLVKLASNPHGLKVLDVDQDGLRDMLIFVQYESPILVRQVEYRKFKVVDWPGAQASLIKEATLSSTAVANVDKKPGAELLVAQKNFARSLFFADGRNWSIIDQYNAKSIENRILTVAAFEVFDDKGRPEILLLDGQKAQLQILKVGDDGTYRSEKSLNVGSWSSSQHLKILKASVTGKDSDSILLFDGAKFAVVSRPSPANPVHHLEQCYTYETKIKNGTYGNLTAGDINSDDRTEIVMVEYKGDHIEILALDSQYKPTPAMRFKVVEKKSYKSKKRGKVGVEPRELQIADVTGDGRKDLVTIIHDRIIIYPQD